MPVSGCFSYARAGQPIEVVDPQTNEAYVLIAKQRFEDGARTFGFILAFFGVGSALGALAVSSGRLPRRYLTVMMTMWKVPDVETQTLMKLFYGKWLRGEEKHQALREAQLDLREQIEKETGHDSPQKWGAFVLVGP